MSGHVDMGGTSWRAIDLEARKKVPYLTSGMAGGGRGDGGGLGLGGRGLWNKMGMRWEGFDVAAVFDGRDSVQAG